MADTRCAASRESGGAARVLAELPAIGQSDAELRVWIIHSLEECPEHCQKVIHAHRVKRTLARRLNDPPSIPPASIDIDTARATPRNGHLPAGRLKPRLHHALNVVFLEGSVPVCSHFTSIGSGSDGCS